MFSLTYVPYTDAGHLPLNRNPINLVFSGFDSVYPTSGSMHSFSIIQASHQENGNVLFHWDDNLWHVRSVPSESPLRLSNIEGSQSGIRRPHAFEKIDNSLIDGLQCHSRQFQGIGQVLGLILIHGEFTCKCAIRATSS